MIPDRARVVVIGGGIAGASIAFHLAKLGWRDVVVLEQGELVSGTTSHAPGLVGQLQSHASLTRVLMHSVALYRGLRLDGVAGYFEVGSLRLAASKPRLVELKRQAAFAKGIGLDVELLTPSEAAKQFPLMSLHGIEGALPVPSDGSATAPLLAKALLNEAVAGSYGGHAVIGFPSGCVTAIDFNDTAPAAAREDMFRVDEAGQVPDRSNVHGWLAAGVPGTLAGLQLALNRYGTWPFARVVQPAIKLARDGFEITDGVARSIKSSARDLARDPGSAALLLPNGEPPAARTTFRNPDLANLLETLADRGSVESFYWGDVARRIANAFQRHGGLVTEVDMNGFRAREVSPLVLDWNGSRIATAPLTAGGLTVLQALAALQALGWETWDRDDPRTSHARIESLRVAWHDRLSLLGDPDATPVPVMRLLSSAYADESAKRVRRAVEDQSIIPGTSDGHSAGGTIPISAADACGTLVALTLTHGEAFGAQITVEGLGLTLGHGMSRFNPRPGHPNSVRPGRRPLHNMCPTIVCRDGRPVIALGATGGRRIPNSLFDVLLNLVAHQQPLATAVAAPRLHTEGGTDLGITNGWPSAHVEYLRHVGYTGATGPMANLNGVSFEPHTRDSKPVP